MTEKPRWKSLSPAEQERIRAGLRRSVKAGRIEVAPPPKDAYLLPDFVKRFFREALHQDYEKCLVTEKSSVMDFDFTMSKAQWLDRIRSLYGVDCSDIAGLNLWDVMRRCEEHC
jgi:hypothetical protein